MKKCLTGLLLSLSTLFCLAQDPTTPPNFLAFTTINQLNISLSWTRGNGQYCLVVARLKVNSIAYPTDGATYGDGGSSFGLGSYLGNGNYVVYKGTGSSINVNNLTGYTEYTFDVYEFNIGSFPYPSVPYYLTVPESGSHYTLATPPTVQASALTASAITSAGATLSWTSGNGTYELASVKQSSNFNTNVPVDGNIYTPVTTYGSGSVLSPSPYSYVVYTYSVNSVAVTGCAAATDYVANCYTYEGISGGQNYLISSNPIKGFTTLAAQPSGNCNSAYFTDATDNAMTVHWIRPTSGAGSKVLVTMRAAGSADLPVDQNDYVANSTFGSGSAVGSSYVVYSGTGNTVRVTGLTANTVYHVAVVEYNGGAGTFNFTNNYATSYLTGYKYTLPAEPTVAASNLVFSNIQTNQVTANWTNGNGNYRQVAVRPSRIQTALAFDGTNDYVGVPYNAATQPSADLTLEAWAHKTSWSGSSGWQTIAGNYETKGYQLFSYYSDIYAYVHANGTTWYVVFNVAYLTAGWHHFAMTFDGQYLRLLVDGAEKAMQDIGGSYPIEYTYSNSFIIGADVGTSSTPTANYFNGYIDEVRLWNVALSTTTIRTNMYKSMLGNETGLAGAWSLNDGFATSAVAANGSMSATTLQGTLSNFASTTAATSFTGTSGWIKSGANVDLPVDYSYYSSNTLFNNGTQIGTRYHSVYYGTGTSVTVTGLTPGTYYDFIVVEDGLNGTYYNYQTSTYLSADVQTVAQPLPTITTFTPTAGNIGANVTITGTNYDATAANNTVYFGASKATVISASTTQLVALVPYCANYVPITVEVNSASVAARTPFLVTNACGGTISSPGSFAASTYTTGVNRTGVLAKDIDVDGKSDLVYLDQGNDALYVMRNQSINGAITLGSVYTVSTNLDPQYAVSEDIDGDGKPDIAATCLGSGNPTIDIFRNQSVAGSVSLAPKIQLPSSASPSTLKLADIDKDGKPDLVVGHATGIISVYRNTSSKGFISFDNRYDLPALSDAYSVDVADFNGDGKIDIIAGDRSANNVSIFQNNSTSGSFSFAAVVNMAQGSGPQGVAVGDLDNDGKPEFCSALQNSTIRVYKNGNTGGSIISGNFTLQTTLATYTLSSASPYAIKINDLDGDGGNDLVCGYVFGGGTVSVFEKTTPTGFAFNTRQDFTTSGTVSYFIDVDDFSMDGKSDIIMANFGNALSIFNNQTNVLASEPLTGPTSVNITSITQTGFTVGFTPGGGGNRLVVVKPSSSAQVFPVDGVEYSYNPDYSLAPDLGGGNRVVYKGGITSAAVTGLSSNTTYNVYVYDYNGATCTTNYLMTPGTSSANTLNYAPTLSSISNPSAICQNSGQQSIGLTGIGTGGESQTLTLSASSSNPTLIPNGNISFTYTSPNATGTILYTPSNKAGTSVITVTVNDGALNNNTFQRTFTVTVTAEPTIASAGSNVSICPGSTNLAANAPSIGSGLWSFVYTSNGAIAINSYTAATSAISGFNVGDSVRLAWTISNSPCAASVSNVSIKRPICPMTADFIANQTAFCGTNATVNFTDLSVNGGNTLVDWTWSFPGGTPNSYNTAVGTNPPAISYTAAGTYTVSLTITSNIPTNDSEVKNNYIVITALPGAATTVSGPSTVCQGQPGVTYSVTPISGASTYSWSVPAGASIIGATNTNTISVDYSAGAAAGNISVTGINSCGNGSTYNRAITVNNLPGATGVIVGPTSACQGQSGVIFTVGAIAGATGYNWTLPFGASIVGGSNTNSVTVNFSNSATDGTINVEGSNACGLGSSSSAYGFSIDSLPLPALSIIGTTTVCPNDTVVYNTATLAYASTYSWTLPSGASIIAGINTETVTVVYSASASAGNITVKGVNACGSGTTSSATITVKPLPDAATSILVNGGNTTVCAGSSGTISCFVSAINNSTGYTWTLPAGFSQVSGSTNSILVSVSPTATSGTISVNGTNACGGGVASSIFVTVSPLPGVANTITGSATVCQTQSGVVYTVPAIANATGYSWAVPLGTSIASGANTNTITVDFSNTAASGTITVTGTNSCGNGLSVDSFAVTVNPLPDAAGIINGDVTITICPVQTGVSYSVTPVNNATGYIWTVPSGAVITSGNNTSSILVNYSDTALSGNISVTPTNACGNGTAANLSVDVDTVPSQSICIVTVDSTSTKNFLVWEKPVTTSIDSFFVYREITGIYTKVGAVDYNALSEFMDNTNGVNPKIAPYKYKVSAVDACGNESYLSAYHRTIHLQVSPASPFGYNLQWTDYEGFPITKYRIMRDTAGLGVYHPADSTSFGTNTWTDTKNYQITDTVGYYIEITFPGGGSCVSTIKNPMNPMAANLNLSKSNINKIADTTVTSVIGVNDSYVVSIYPNPNKGLFTLELNQLSGRGEVTVFNMLGETVKNLTVSENEEKLRIDLSNQLQGVYQVEVKCGNSIVNKKIIIQ